MKQDQAFPDQYPYVPPPAPPPAPIAKDETIDRTVWDPSSEQMDAYRTREVEMCIVEIRKFESKPLNGKLRQDMTLFSFKTWEAAHKEILHNPVV